MASQTEQHGTSPQSVHSGSFGAPLRLLGVAYPPLLLTLTLALHFLPPRLPLPRPRSALPPLPPCPSFTRTLLSRPLPSLTLPLLALLFAYSNRIKHTLQLPIQSQSTSVRLESILGREDTLPSGWSVGVGVSAARRGEGGREREGGGLTG